MKAVERRAITRQFRILSRAVRRGEATDSQLREFAAKHSDVLGENAADAPIPAGESVDAADTPFSTRDGVPLHLRDLYAGAAVFLVLGGPSIKTLDLSLLRRRGAIAFGINNSPSLIRPHLWTFVDKPLKFHDAIWRDPGVMKFVPEPQIRRSIREKDRDGFRTIHRGGDENVPVQCGEMPGVVAYKRNAFFRPDRWLDEPSINWGNSLKSSRENRNHRSLNTMFAVLKISYWLGFRVVYMLGCDFKMQADAPYAFDQGGNQGKADANNNGYAVMSEMFAELAPRFDAAGFHVFNCNSNSGLTVFPHVPYKEAIASATGHVPQDPLDTAGWYD